ncbi:unnamed protein product [Orchesella dallaii]|uniref:Odorant receptor n=1 Tax=Orchesella dallaii TaxID=48710 RepID=A0ABP1Q314_9HEXA
MGLGDAFINLQLVFQQVYEMPFFYSHEKAKLIINPNLKNWRKMLKWHLTKYGILALTLNSIYKGTKLFLNIEENDIWDPEQAFVYVAIAGAGIQTLVTMYTMERQPEAFTYFSTQILKLGKILPQGWPSSQRLPDIQELEVYGFTWVCMLSPFMGALYAILRGKDPINVELKGVLPDVPRIILAASLNWYLAFFAGVTCSAFLGLILTVCHVFEKETEANKNRSLGISSANMNNRLECMVQKILVYIFTCLDSIFRRKRSATIQPLVEVVIGERAPTLEQESVIAQFYNSFRHHRQLSLLMATSNKNVQVFIPTMAFVGIMLCTIFSYALLTMYDNPEFQFMFPVIALFLVSINFLVLFFCEHASLPLIYTEETIRFWKGMLKGKLEKRLVTSMQPFGFTLGAFFLAKRGTALEINDIILNNTISLLLG